MVQLVVAPRADEFPSTYHTRAILIANDNLQLLSVSVSQLLSRPFSPMSITWLNHSI